MLDGYCWSIMTMTLLSNAFSHQERIPQMYTCKGQAISPALEWKNVPDGTQSFALIMQDIDVKLTRVIHWIVYNIPSDQHFLPEDFNASDPESDEILIGKNTLRKNSYMGPCPPIGCHRYQFILYALDTKITNANLTKKKLLKEMNGHILSKAELIGLYSKK